MAYQQHAGVDKIEIKQVVKLFTGLSLIAGPTHQHYCTVELRTLLELQLHVDGNYFIGTVPRFLDTTLQEVSI